MISTTSLYAILSTLYSKYEAKNTLPDWFAMNLKTLLSKNITIQDWNTLQLYLKNVIGESQAIYEFCQNLVEEIVKIDAYINKDLLDYINEAYTKIATIESYIPSDTSVDNKLMNESKFQNFATKEDLANYTPLTKFEELVKQTPTGIAINANNEIYLEHDGVEITGQPKKVRVVSQAAFDEIKELIPNEASVENPLVAKNQLNGLATKEELNTYTPLSNFNNLKALIPTEASTDNLLADRSWVISQIGTVYRYKGSVKNYSDLPTNANNGDVYNVENAYLQYPAGTNYAWNGSTWDALGGSVDLSAYVTQTSLTTTLKDYVTQASLTQTLASYATKDDLDSYATKTMLNNYVTNSALTELLGSYATITSLNSHVTNTANPHKVTKTQVGLGNVDNTSDLNKPISTATQNALDDLQDSVEATGHELSISDNVVKLLDANGTAISQITLPERGKIDTISVNGVQQSVVNKNVDITTPVIEILESED